MQGAAEVSPGKWSERTAERFEWLLIHTNKSCSNVPVDTLTDRGKMVVDGAGVGVGVGVVTWLRPPEVNVTDTEALCLGSHTSTFVSGFFRTLGT